ncbi:MAG: S8 family peptidase [Fusobacteriaceae bacterium]
MERKLPIRIFERRNQVDERRVEGGGGNKPVSWILSGERLEKQAEILTKDLFSFKSKQIRDKSLLGCGSSIMEVKIIKDSIAKSHREAINKIFCDNVNNIIGVKGDDKLLFKISKLESEEILNKIKDFTRYDKGISAIEKIQILKSDINEGNEEILKLKLVKFKDNKENTVLSNYFEKLFDKEKIEYKKCNYNKGLNIYEIKGNAKIVSNIVKDNSMVLSLEPMPVVTGNFLGHSGGILFDDEKILEEKEYPLVGVLDSGISKNFPLKNFIKDRNTNYIDEDMCRAHGTFVAGIVCCGDKLEGESLTGANRCRIIDAAIIPNIKKQMIYETEIIDNIRENIERYPEVNIWTLSIGSSVESDIDKFSDFAMALDELQDEYNILIIKSAGNCDNFKKNIPVSRITNGADSIRALTIGSCDINKKISKFSRIGKGPCYIVKPELVHVGENVKSFSENGEIVTSSGTSFSTPRVASLASTLATELNESFDPLLIKTLLIHSAKYSENDLSQSEKLNQYGFGIPDTIEQICYNTKNEITLILRQTLNKSEEVDILEFPFPEKLITDDGFYRGRIKVTVGASSLLEGTEGGEYCQSNLEVKLGTYDEKVSRDTSKPFILNPIGKEGNKNLLLDSIYSKNVKNFKGKNDFIAKERLLVRYGNKYCPIKKYSLDLEMLTDTNKEYYLKAPKKWFLSLEGSYRKNLEMLYESQRKSISQEICIIITISDPEKNIEVYDDVVSKLNEYNFIQREIKLKSNIKIRV